MSCAQELTSLTDDALARHLKEEAARVGFDLAGIAPAVTPVGFPRLQEWLQLGYAGEMAYLPNREEAYAHPEHVLSSVRSVIVLAMNYRTAEPAEPGPGEARVARYAWGREDYHDLLRRRMKTLAGVLHAARPGCRTRAVVDTAPLLERDFARLAGLGWFGKNTMLINKRAGSWLFLCAILTDASLPADEPHETSHCGTCTRCLDVCPTDAFPEPGVMDARRCISYLTIELRDRPIPHELREGMQDWVFGCDLCQDVCPWNGKAPVSHEGAFEPQRDLDPASAVNLLGLSEEQFVERFRNTPLARPGRAGLLRNAAVVLGNCGNASHLAALKVSLGDDEPLIRGAAAWAIGRLGSAPDAAELQSRLVVENNADVRRELELALAALTTSTGATADADPD